MVMIEALTLIFASRPDASVVQTNGTCVERSASGRSMYWSTGTAIAVLIGR